MRTTGLRFFAAWLGATLVAVVVAAAAVGSVRSQLTDAPTPFGGSASGTFQAENSPQGSSVPDPAGADPVGSTTTVSVVSTSVTTTSAPTSPSSTTSSTSTTSTTTPTSSSTQAQSYSQTFDTAGGSVRVVVEGSDVSFGGAVPKTGWRVELKKSGPEEVKVEFEQNDGDGNIEFTAKVEHGELVTEISSEDHED